MARQTVRSVREFLSKFADDAVVTAYEGEGGSWILIDAEAAPEKSGGELNTNYDPEQDRG